MKTKDLVSSALLIALSIAIPYLSLPVIPTPEFSMTLGSHVPIMAAMFVSPVTAVFTVLGTTLAFFLKGTPFVVVMRAASHIFFALGGALILAKRQDFLGIALAFIAVLALHVAAEVYVIYLLMPAGVALWFGAGVFALHTLIDFALSLVIVFALKKGGLMKTS